ncbi:MAG TPA: gamma-glutamyl-gamma-aminobutyrate hydrolase family protein [Methanospirillum sp.]|uniref:type 1 glutamine amidotransferase n=1 Tax=Methanospirillum sp. TaxID=45200 RepID=UPI002C652DF6|nr:gamma-glutamyl-gamma-aminobutyrate hydrolase family protein [Methanospirillum sp.]HWQ63883.1 gamma-glutamyl-gamma-aminobutyrate hydrolase family protein [Methanospirillum sp.]
MITILDCTRQDLSLLKYEFVSPITNIVQIAGFNTIVLPLATHERPSNLKGIILTGTSLMDDHYLSIGIPEWVLQWAGPVLGICAGMQLITITYGGRLVPSEAVGMTEIRCVNRDQIVDGKEQFTGWELHRSGVETSGNVTVLARSASGIQMIRTNDRPWYGVLFHPEVRNEWLITNFLNICSKQGQ